MNWKSAMTVVFSGCLFLCSAAFAANCDTDSCTAKVEKLYVNANGTIYIQLHLASSDIGSLNCSPVAGIYFSMNPSTDSNAQSMYATLLAAAHAGIPVDLRAEDGVTGCQVVYVTESFP